MIYINHDRRAVFVHVPKTGGSYVGPTLVQHYGFTCYLTTLLSRRPDHDHVCRVRDFPSALTPHEKYNNTFFNKWVGVLSYCQTSVEMSAAMGMTEEKWRTYTVYGFVRDPATRWLSGWCHMQRIGLCAEDSAALLRRVFDARALTQVSDLVYGHVAMPQSLHLRSVFSQTPRWLGRYEHLEQDLCAMLHHLGFTTRLHRPVHVNVSNASARYEMDARCEPLLRHWFADDYQLWRMMK